MIKINTIYKFKSEFAKELSIPANQVDRRQDELLTWLSNFFDYEFFEGCPKRILIKEIYGDYQPLPRKVPSQAVLSAEKKEKYKNFTIAALGTEFKPNSQSKVAREAIEAFGYEDYKHTNVRAVSTRYIKEPFKAYGETDNKKIWVWYSTYEKIDSGLLEEWR